MSDATTGNAADLLRSWLATRDEACPGCGYNLRSVEAGTCPECGRDLTLALREPGGLSRRRGLLSLVFAFLLLTGLLNGAAAVRSVHRTMTAPGQTAFVWRSPPLPGAAGAPSGAGLGRRWGFDVSRIDVPGLAGFATLPAGSLPMVIDPALATAPMTVDVDIATVGPGSAPAAQDDATGVVTDQGPAPGTSEAASGAALAPALVTLRVATPTVAPAGGLRWSGVSWRQWLGAAWWTTLALGAGLALAVVVAYRRRGAPPRLGPRLVTVAWLGVAGCVAAHAVQLVGEWR